MIVVKETPTLGVFMKNSPHKRKHQVNKAIRQASLHSLKGEKSPFPYKVDAINFLKKSKLALFSKENALRILNIYKKNLEISEYTHKHIHPKYSISQLEGNRPFSHPSTTDKKAEKHWLKHDLTKSGDVARKILKRHNLPHKKAA